MVEFDVVTFSPSPSAPSASCCTRGGIGKVWTQSQGDQASREFVAVAGVEPDESTIHSLRIAGATQFSAGGVARNVL